MSGAKIVNLAAWRAGARHHRERLAYEAEQERRQREDSERLRRLLDGDWPPPGGHAA